MRLIAWRTHLFTFCEAATSWATRAVFFWMSASTDVSEEVVADARLAPRVEYSRLGKWGRKTVSGLRR